MRITNAKVQRAIDMLNSKTNCKYELRTINTRADKGKYRYILYCRVDEYGFAMPGTYGFWTAGFNKISEFCSYVSEV